jgi:hypothetical protein
MKLTDTIKDLEALKDFIAAALVDAQSAQNDADESKTSETAVHPFDWTEAEWRKDGFGTQHTEALHLLDEARQHFRLS